MELPNYRCVRRLDEMRYCFRRSSIIPTRGLFQVIRYRLSSNRSKVVIKKFDTTQPRKIGDNHGARVVIVVHHFRIRTGTSAQTSLTLLWENSE